MQLKGCILSSFNWELSESRPPFGWGLSGALGSDATLIGDPNDSEWTLAGKLSDSHLHNKVEDYARVVGKIST